MDLLIYSLPFAIAFTILDLKIHQKFDKKCQDHYITLQKYKDPKSKTKRSYTLVKWGYSLIYYLIFSIYGYIIIKDTQSWPTWLGGNGSCYNILQNGHAITQTTFAMKIFYCFQFGKHISRMMYHMFIRQEGNYYEYILHHSLSTFLIFFSFLMNMWIVGIIVLLLTDFSDFFLIFARWYRDYRHYSKKFLQFIYVIAACAWIFCRIIIFNVCVVYPMNYGAIYIMPQHLKDQLTWQVIFYPYWFMAIMLAALEVLQIFWTYYIMSSFISVNVSQNLAKHNYD